MKLKLVGDGTTGGSNIYTEGGEPVEGVDGIFLAFDKARMLPTVTLRIRLQEIDLQTGSDPHRAQYDRPPE